MDDDHKTPEDDYFVGRRFQREGVYFNSGGAGYALSRGTLRKYVHEGWNHPNCSPWDTTSMEDVMISKCLLNVFGIGLTDTRDHELRERFHPFSPDTHYLLRPPGGKQFSWYFDYNQEWPVLLEEMCCSPESVSFHYIKNPAMVRHLYALINTCDR
jgi:glycoprotein-N-acetylgalactosamine 3-beta-galactosyltransferase